MAITPDYATPQEPRRERGWGASLALYSLLIAAPAYALMTVAFFNIATNLKLWRGLEFNMILDCAGWLIIAGIATALIAGGLFRGGFLAGIALLVNGFAFFLLPGFKC